MSVLVRLIMALLGLAGGCILLVRDDGTALVYRGELGTDLRRLGQWWGARVAGPWERTVARPLESIRAQAERRSR